MEPWIVCSQLLGLIPVDPCLLAQQLCSLWVDAHPLNCSEVLLLYPEPSASGIPIGFPAAGKEQGDELLWKSCFREGTKEWLCPFLIGISGQQVSLFDIEFWSVFRAFLWKLGQTSMEMLELCCTPSSKCWDFAGWVGCEDCLCWVFFPSLKPACVHSVAAWDGITESWNH